MKKLDFAILPGWPASVDTWKYLQEMITDLEKLSYLGGTNYVVKGCEENAGNVSNGIIVIAGEVLPFEGGAVQANVIVIDEPVQREFFGGALNNYYHNRKATFGLGAGQVAWADIAKPDPAKGVLQRLDKIEKMLKPLIGYDVAGTTVYGSWLFWGRPANEIPAGWEAVPDAEWKGKIPVVMNDADNDFNDVGKTGGVKSNILLKTNLPNINLETEAFGNRGWPSDSGDRADNQYFITPTGGTNGTKKLTVPLGGSNTPINNMPPFKVVMFIRFIG